LQAIPFNNSYARLPAQFHTALAPTPVEKPGPIRVNRTLATQLGLDPDWLASTEGTQVIAGNHVPSGAEPIATVYAGHQFGGYNPQLGDGRAILLGELTPAEGARFDLQLKGSGPTPYSRGGDGRAPLGPVLREYILCEAMYALGVPTTRALAAVTSGEMVARESYLPGAVLARVASSHIRIGTFEYFGAKQDTGSLQLLSQHVIERHFPTAAQSDNPVLAMLQAVIGRQAELVSRWQALGFIHGVMNTDNMLLCGETIDYGPCAFMDIFDPAKVYSSIDHAGRYAYRNQPGIAHWNLSQLAQSLLPLLHTDEAQATALAQTAIDAFPGQFLDAHNQAMASKLGIEALTEADTPLIEDLFKLLEEQRLDFTLSFRRLADLADEAGARGQDVGALFEFPTGMQDWLERWQQRLQQEPRSPAARQRAMYRANPALIPRNHLVDQALKASLQEADFATFHRLVDALAKPWDYRPELADYARGPVPEEEVQQTFCGT
jgi:uncharacterized protein YdiU (UPF0061 family)